MDIKYQVGEQIKHFRKLKGFSQEKLALMSDISPSFLGHIGTWTKKSNGNNFRKNITSTTYPDV